MLKNIIPKWLNGLAVGTLLFSNTLLWGCIVLILGLIKLVLPMAWVSNLLHSAYQGWCSGNRLGLKFSNAKVTTVINGDVNKLGWYLLISNHFSWLDIVVLSAIDVLPAPKFFLKDELKYVPLIGSGAWAMGMPFMKRISKAQVAKNPKLKGLDVERTKHSCRNFRSHPTTIINFVEGTRFTAAKHQAQQSPFKHLLKPKAGGVAFALEVLGEQFDAILNTTLMYQAKSNHICASFLRGRLSEVTINITLVPVSSELLGNYQQDSQFRARFQASINQLWLAKDSELAMAYAQRNAEAVLINNKEIKLP
ncbi:acetyltransferase [Pseudoalteromonas sp. KAN5]|uniref:acetyltransferase n=1 Tax=Pseudoalteromonas sp. KAN5 TaxID=2916633 RepID=UPI001FCBF8B8|nr:acetyltransferase [Pseudoalteromonas sp. KAN5]BDF96240.1 acyltransferase [Pseudoalteromonas sp. KAN5]